VKKRKISKRILSIGMAVVMLFGVMAIVGCISESPKRQVERLLGIELPRNIELLFNHRPTGFVQGGRHPQYTLFQLYKTPDELLENNTFRVGVESREIFDSRLYTYRGHRTINGERRPIVPEEFHPPWGETFYWMSYNARFLIFFPNQLWLIFIIIGN